MKNLNLFLFTISLAFGLTSCVSQLKYNRVATEVSNLRNERDEALKKSETGKIDTRDLTLHLLGFFPCICERKIGIASERSRVAPLPIDHHKALGATNRNTNTKALEHFVKIRFLLCSATRWFKFLYLKVCDPHRARLFLDSFLGCFRKISSVSICLTYST